MADRCRRYEISRLPRRAGGGVGRSRKPKGGGCSRFPDGAPGSRLQSLLHRTHGSPRRASDEVVRFGSGLLLQRRCDCQRGGNQTCQALRANRARARLLQSRVAPSILFTGERWQHWRPPVSRPNRQRSLRFRPAFTKSRQATSAPWKQLSMTARRQCCWRRCRGRAV